MTGLWSGRILVAASFLLLLGSAVVGVLVGGDMVRFDLP